VRNRVLSGQGQVEGPGGEGLYGLGCSPDDASLVIVPVPFEATVSYRPGTAAGPQAILDASSQIDLFDLETGRPYEAGLAMLPINQEVVVRNTEARSAALKVIEGGGVESDPSLAQAAATVDAHSEWVDAWVDRTVTELLESGKRAGVLGGDHSVAYGSIAAHARKWPGLGILHVDAHADLRSAYEGFRFSHASVFRNVREHIDGVASVVSVGLRDLAESEHRILESDPRFHPFYDPWLRARLHEGTPWAELAATVVERLPETVYVSFDIDGLDPSLCPGTGTPVPGGLSFPEATALLKAVVNSGREIVGFDLCEVGGDDWDANVGARVLYKLIGFSLLSRAGR
jgi:agmatinase